MAQKHLLHELLKQTQEPFHLKSFISDRKNSLLNKKPSPITITSQPKNPKPTHTISTKRATNNLRHQTSPPEAMSLRVPPKTADVLLEAAIRIQKSKLQQPQIKNVGLGFFGSFLKILRDRSKGKKIFRNSEADEREKLGGDIISRGLSGGDREARPSTCRQYEESDQITTGDFGLLETRYCASPFRFSFCQSSSSSGYRTPEFCSPAASPNRRVNQEKENYATGENSEDSNVVADEEKEQCSPVSVLDTFFEDDVHESRDEEEDGDYDPECSYANMQRTKQQLLDRLRRFEKLAELDPTELERNFLEDSEDEHERESVVSEDDHKPSYEKQSLDRFLNEAFCLSNLQHSSRKVCTDEKRLVSGLMVEKKGKITCFGNKEIVLEFDMVETMGEFDLKRGFEGREETVEEIEVAIFGQLLEEFVVHGMDEQH